jgi:uridine phosphorylase
MTPAGPFNASDLPVDEKGRIYHLQISPDQIASDIILVGDPGRAKFVGSRFFREVEVEHEHRGLVTVTGIAEISGKPATIISPRKTTVSTHGIGTPSLEIVIGEIVALKEIDFTTRVPKTDFPRLHVLRLGTSGGLQASTKLGTSIITSYGVGLDNTAFFYETPHQDDHCARIEGEVEQIIHGAMRKDSRFYGKIHPYVSHAEPTLVDALREAAEELDVPAQIGLTVSNSGFFAPQGRDIFRLHPTVADLDQILSEYNPGLDGQRIENMEMEASYLIHFLTGLGHWAGAICPTIAHRREDTFDHHYQESIARATRVALLALANLRSRYPDARISGSDPHKR